MASVQTIEEDVKAFLPNIQSQKIYSPKPKRLYRTKPLRREPALPFLAKSFSEINEKSNEDIDLYSIEEIQQDFIRMQIASEVDDTREEILSILSCSNESTQDEECDRIERAKNPFYKNLIEE